MNDDPWPQDLLTEDRRIIVIVIINLRYIQHAQSLIIIEDDMSVLRLVSKCCEEFLL